jgi:hemerythrin superfamily protein
MDVVKLIRQDHRFVRSLFRKFRGADRRTQKQKLGQQIIEELSVHAVVEEQLVYPLLREREKRLEAPVLDALEEHHAMKLVLAELDRMTPEDERYEAKLHVVQEAVEMHIEEEESQLLPRLEKLFDRDERRELGGQMSELKLIAPNRPHPGAPDTPPGNVVAGLAAKMFDAGRGVVRGVTNMQKAQGSRRVQARARAGLRK